MAKVNSTKKGPKKVRVNVYGQKKVSKKKGDSFAGVMSMLQDVKRELEVSDDVQEKPRAYDYKKGKKKGAYKIKPSNMQRNIDEERRKGIILWVGVVSIMFIIFVAWIATLKSSNFFDISQDVSQPSTLDNIKDEMKGSYDDFTATMQQLQAELTEVQEDIEKAEAAQEQEGTAESEAQQEVDTNESVINEQESSAEDVPTNQNNSEPIQEKSSENDILPADPILPIGGVEVTQ